MTGVQRETQTWDAGERSRDGAGDHPRLIRFFRADDPFHAPEAFTLAGEDEWSLGRVDSDRGGAAEKGRIWSCGDTIMSSRHATVSASKDGWWIADAGSKNGTFVDGVRLLEPRLLQHGAIVECGHSFFLFYDGDVTAASVHVPRGLSLDFPPLHYQIAPLSPYITSDVSVHLQGETGTGKEVVARAIHGISGRRGAFVARNCAAIPETLFEAELFGYTKGAFSGAATHHPGQIAAADGGTLFLDEIGELSLPMQAKLLRALELKEVLPLGARSPVRVDFRLVSATLCDLEARVQAGSFRRDLYGRLGRIFKVPPLREHKEELGRLVQVFLAARLTERLERMQPNPIVYFTLGAARALAYYAWPYNLRELKQCIDTALLGAMSTAGANGSCAIDLCHLPASMLTDSRNGDSHSSDSRNSGSRPVVALHAPATPAPGDGRERILSDAEILGALERVQGNRAQAAKILGISERTIFRRIKKARPTK